MWNSIPNDTIMKMELSIGGIIVVTWNLTLKIIKKGNSIWAHPFAQLAHVRESVKIYEFFL